MSKTNKLLKAAMATKTKNNTSIIPRDHFLSTGSMELNLACSGRTDCGIPKGFFALFVGDSSTGKSFFGMTILAEAANSDLFDGYKLVYDNAEKGALPSVPKFFGNKLAERIQPPRGTWDEPEDSANLEDFYDNATDHLDEGPCVYILDSMDALIPKDDEVKFDKAKSARRKGKEEAGSYGTSKAKMNSANLRILKNKLKKHGSILIVISQTRHSIGFGSQFNPKTRGGGDALRFYCRLEMWLSNMGSIKKSVNGKQRVIGQKTKVKMAKNHINGWAGSITVPIYRSVGIDHIGGSVDFLIEEKVWKGSKKSEESSMVDTKGFVAKKMKRDKLIELIQNSDREDKLRKLVAQTWHNIENESAVTRKPRYA